MIVKNRPAPPSAPTLTFCENSSIFWVMSSIPGKTRLAMKSVRCERESKEPTLRRMVRAMAVTGTSDSAVVKDSAAACWGHLSRAHCFRMRRLRRVR